MDYLVQRLSELRQEIAHLRSTNASYLQSTERSESDQSGYELRNNRLLQIKKELSGMLSRPREGSVWWERSRGGLQN
jgi:hypothetical protein